LLSPLFCFARGCSRQPCARGSEFELHSELSAISF